MFTMQTPALTISKLQKTISHLITFLLLSAVLETYIMYSLFGETIIIHGLVYFLFWAMCLYESLYNPKIATYLIAAASIYFWPGAITAAFHTSFIDWRSPFLLVARIGGILEIIIFLLTYLLLLLQTSSTFFNTNEHNHHSLEENKQ